MTANTTPAVTLTPPQGKPNSAVNTSPSKPVKKLVQKPVRKVVKKAEKKAVKKVVKSAAAPKSVPQTVQAKPQQETKAKKPKLVRDSFTFPKDEYQAIGSLKQKALNLKRNAKKSEILRAGLKLLSSLNDKAFLLALTKVPTLATGRPAKS